jgi:putative glycerol-1-phosphate prenyltransferase
MSLKIDEIINTRKQGLAVLVDPDKFDKDLIKLLDNSVSLILVGGSKLKKGNVKDTVKQIKKLTRIPVVLFPGSEEQVCKEADGIFILSLLSGRNTEYLIEKQVRAAKQIKKLKLQTFPVAYILVESGSVSETQKVSKTKPLQSKPLIVSTAIAAQQLGFKAVYLEAGSGSHKQVNKALIKQVKKNIDIPLIVGGGIDSAAKAKQAKDSGANLVVVGNALEKNRFLMDTLSKVFVY